MEFKQDQFFQAVASRKIPRVRIAGIAIADDAVLVQQPAGDPHSCYAFIGGEYKVGGAFETRLRARFEEETNTSTVEAQYLFCVENHFRYKGNLPGMAGSCLSLMYASLGDRVYYGKLKDVFCEADNLLRKRFAEMTLADVAKSFTKISEHAGSARCVSSVAYS